MKKLADGSGSKKKCRARLAKSFVSESGSKFWETTSHTNLLGPLLGQKWKRLA